jgi:hypothetical protein
MYLHFLLRFSTVGTTHGDPEPFVGWYATSLVKSTLSEEETPDQQ